MTYNHKAVHDQVWLIQHCNTHPSTNTNFPSPMTLVPTAVSPLLLDTQHASAECHFLLLVCNPVYLVVVYGVSYVPFQVGSSQIPMVSRHRWEKATHSPRCSEVRTLRLGAQLSNRSTTRFIGSKPSIPTVFLILLLDHHKGRSEYSWWSLQACPGEVSMDSSSECCPHIKSNVFLPSLGKFAQICIWLTHVSPGWSSGSLTVPWALPGVMPEWKPRAILSTASWVLGSRKVSHK